MSDKVSKMFNDMNENEKHNEIFNSFMFVDTENLKNKNEVPLVSCNYSCIGNKCYFNKCLLAIENNVDLLKYSSKETCLQIVKDIDNNQDNYLPSSIDGYSINRMGKELVRIKRIDDKNEKDSSITGLIEYNTLIKKEMDWNEHKKIKYLSDIMNDNIKIDTKNDANNDSNNINKSNCNIM